MNKRDKIEYILGLVKEQLEEFLEFEERTGFDISPEEMIIASIEQVTSQSITRTTYSSPVGTVDRKNVQYMIDDEISLPVYGDEYDKD